MRPARRRARADLFTGRHPHRVRLAAKRQVGLYMKPTSGRGGEELLFESGSRKMPMAWSPDGQFIIYWVAGGASRWVMPVKNPSEARQLHDRPIPTRRSARRQVGRVQLVEPDLREAVSHRRGSLEGFLRGRRLCAMARRLEGAVFLQDDVRSDDGRRDQRDRIDSQAEPTTRAVRQPVREPRAPEQLPHLLGCRRRAALPDSADRAYSLTVFDRGGKVVRTLDRGVYFSPVWSPDGTRVAVVKDSRQVWVVDANTARHPARRRPARGPRDGTRLVS